MLQKLLKKLPNFSRSSIKLAHNQDGTTEKRDVSGGRFGHQKASVAVIDELMELENKCARGWGRRVLILSRMEGERDSAG